MSTLLDFLITQRAEFRTARLHSLYSDFRSQRTINPDGYAANIAAWESGLAAAAKAGIISEGSLAIQFGSQLERDLQTRENGLPQALGAVVEESVIHGRMIPLSNFLSSPKSIYDRSWDLNLTKVPLKLASWVLQQAGLVSRAAKDPKQRYVLVSNLEEAGNAVAHALTERTRRVDRAISAAEFRDEVVKATTNSNPTVSDLEILLTFLHRDKNLIAYNDQAVKVKSPSEKEAVLTPEDVNICSLKTLISDINGQVNTITERIEQLQAKAKEAIGKKNKISAMAALKSKKLQEDLLTKRTNTLTQLEGVYSNIEEAADQVEIVKAMEGSTQVLRSLTSEMGGIERVEDVLENLQEEMAKVNDVSTVIGEQGSLAAGIDEAAIDDELEQLEADARAEEVREEAEATRKRLDALELDKVPENVGQPSKASTQEPSKLVADTS